MASLLPPESRLQFGTALQPPAGYRLEALVGTTYSLDLLTALTVPLAIEARVTVDREHIQESEVELLAALKRAARRISIFVEAGNIGPFSTQASRLAALLEGSIHQVKPARGTSFHPKLWAMRYDPIAPKAPVLTRLLILSRNLTQSRSWDAALRLEGEVSSRHHDDNSNLCDFVRYLSKASGQRQGAQKQLLDALEKTKWSLPLGFDEFEFAAHHPGSRQDWTPRPCQRMAVVSPFCDDTGLGMLRKAGAKELVLVSTDQWLAQVSEVSRPVQCLVLSPGAVPEADGCCQSNANLSPHRAA